MGKYKTHLFSSRESDGEIVAYCGRTSKKQKRLSFTPMLKCVSCLDCVELNLHELKDKIKALPHEHHIVVKKPSLGPLRPLSLWKRLKRFFS